MLLMLLGIWVHMATANDLCGGMPELSDWSQAVYHHAIPSGRQLAGKYSKDLAATDLLSCLTSCCSQPDCDVVFFHLKICYHIQCNVSRLNSCNPDVKTSSRFNETVMVSVRQVVYRPLSTQPVGLPVTTSVSITEDDHLEPTLSRTPPAAGCMINSTATCGLNEVCVSSLGMVAGIGQCLCASGYTRLDNGSCRIPNPGSATAVTNASSSLQGTSLPTPPLLTAPPPVTPVKVTQMTVSAGDSRVLRLPENSVVLSAFVLPAPAEMEAYNYDWSLVTPPAGAEMGEMEGKHSRTLVLSKLIAGLYTFRVQVTGANKFGEAFVNVTVLPAARSNSPPKAVVTPTSQEVKSSNTAILDGQGSTDDDKIVSYKWEEIKGPLQDHQIHGDTAMLTLQNLAPGNYTFRLTVTDSDGVSNSTEANVTAIRETNYPPKANAGSNIVINLPQNSVVLYGNASTDDKKIVSYEWIKKADDRLTADMKGTRTPFLELTNLQVGDYTFTLKVTDEDGLSSQADVHVFVKPATNQPPVARTASHTLVPLPADYLVLDGSNSTDDTGIVSYSWQQISGPTMLILQHGDQAVATASGPVAVGEYVFNLTVTDSNQQQNSAPLSITIHQSINLTPVANAGGDLEVLLPAPLVTLDGTRSTDDHGIATYTWQREGKSLAFGEVVNGSDRLPILQLVNIVPGHYSFSLTVTDSLGLSSSDSVSVVIKKDPHELDLLQIVVDAEPEAFTEDSKAALVGELQLLLHRSAFEGSGDCSLEVHQISRDPSTGYITLTLLAVRRTKELKTVLRGIEVVHTFRRKLSAQPNLMDVHILSIDTVVCQNNCSGHGRCDQRSRRCLCEAFWMENFLAVGLLQGDFNCDWSVLYVVIVGFIGFITLIGSVWSLLCLLRSQRCQLKLRRRHRYSLLREADDDEHRQQLELLPTGSTQNSSVMRSDSDLSTEEETLFIKNKKFNGLIYEPLNGLSKPRSFTKLKA